MGRQIGKGQGLELALDAWWARRRPEIRTAFPAFVSQYDHVAKLATVQPSIRQRYSDGRPNVAAAPLAQRPVIQVARGAGWVITHELAPGDQVLCLAADRALDSWEGSDGALVDPRMRRYHAAMDAVVLGGLAPAGAQTTVGEPGELFVGREDGQVSLRLRNDGRALLTAGPVGAGATIEIRPDGTVVVTPAPGKRVEIGGVGGPNLARVGDTMSLDNPTIAAINAIATAAGAPPFLGGGGIIDPNICCAGATDA